MKYRRFADAVPDDDVLLGIVADVVSILAGWWFAGWVLRRLVHNIEGVYDE